MARLNPDEALIKALVRAVEKVAARKSSSATPADWQNVDLSLGTKVRYDMVDVKTDSGVEVGFQAIDINGPRKQREARCGPELPLRRGVRAHDGHLDARVAQHGAAHPQPGREPDAARGASDGYEGRIGYYAQMACKAPGYNVRIAMPSSPLPEARAAAVWWRGLSPPQRRLSWQSDLSSR
jgi:hypothetical protein